MCPTARLLAWLRLTRDPDLDSLEKEVVWRFIREMVTPNELLRLQLQDYLRSRRIAMSI